MTRAIVSAVGLACLTLGVAGAAPDGAPAINTRPASAGDPNAPSRPTTAASSPLPTQIWWSGRESLLVNESGIGRIVEIELRTGRPVSPKSIYELPGRTFAAPAPNRKQWAAISPRNPVVTIHEGDILGSGPLADDRGALKSIAIGANPQALAFSPDSMKVLVTCDTPGPADRRIYVVDIATGSVSDRAIRGSSNLRGIAVDPHGKFALVVHLIHKSHLPSTQIEQGWVFTNAITYLSLAGPPVSVSLPLDLRTQGFANPEGVAITPDGHKAYVAHAGADLVSVIDMPTLLEIVAASPQTANETIAQSVPGGYMHEDLRLTRRYVRTRIPVGSNPRGIAVAPDGKFVAVANRLDDSISLIDVASDSVVSTISLLETDGQPPAEALLVRLGEKLFHSARLSFSGQFSCASCHPDGHTDGLNWDLPADGFNNFHNTKSLLSIDGTAPYGWLGTSATLRDRFAGTLRHLFQHEPTENESAALEAYLAQLQVPEPVGRPSAATDAAVTRGKMLFEGKAGCRACHSGAKFTDRHRHDIGTGTDGRSEFDTPALLGVSTTAPYLHDGRAATLDEIFTKHNPTALHGNAANLAPQELADLVAFLKGL